jgi:hypothetical protein
VLLYVDSTRQISESDESNNWATFEVEFKYYYPSNLPRCP